MRTTSRVVDAAHIVAPEVDWLLDVSAQRDVPSCGALPDWSRGDHVR